jgi:hypothetical protein
MVDLETLNPIHTDVAVASKVTHTTRQRGWAGSGFEALK